MEWTTHAAQHYARIGQLEAWIAAYLSTGYWANLGLAQGLRRQRRWWRGPILSAVDELIRVCGPEPEMEYIEDAEVWEQTVTRIQHSITDPLLVPPLIVEYRQGTLSVRDGCHRLEAFRRLGWEHCWIVIWYNNEEDFVQDKQREQT
jgi:hypothetical protein